MKQYLNTIRHVLAKGTRKENRTDIATIGVFGHQEHFDLSQGFPLLTTKKVHFPAIVHELLWFIKGDTNIKYLVDNNVRIWNEWPFETFKKSEDYNGEDLAQFIERIKSDEAFAQKHGDLGPVYGKQWRDFGGVDQLVQAIEAIKNNPQSRRIIVSAWNPPEIPFMALPPCHCFFHFSVSDGKLNCLLYQRSCDLFLGVPFNIASYALLTYMVAHVTGLKPGTFVHTYGDLHIYENHIEQVNLQLTREPKKLPTLKLNPKVKDIFSFTFEDITLEGYEPHPAIKGIVAV